MRAAGAAAQVDASWRVYHTFFCEHATSTALRIRKPCSASSGCASMYCAQPSAVVLSFGFDGVVGVFATPTVDPISTIVAPASVRYFNAPLDASVVPVVPKGSSQTAGMKPIRLPLSASLSSTERQSAGRSASAGALTGSAGSVPVTTFSMSARSGTERAIAPPKSVCQTSGMMPEPDSSPSVPRSVTSEAPDAGPYSESPVCEPIAPAASEAATAVAEPPDEAIADFDGWNAFHTWPHGSL